MNSDRNDEQLEQVRSEIRAAAATLRDRPRLAPSPPAQPAGADGVEPARRHYRIAELTDPPYHAFVEHAFRALLKRAPTPSEASAQHDLLGRGASKAEVLGNLRWSAEGRRTNVAVTGLLPRYLLAKLGRVPVLGYLVQWGLALAALPMLARQLRAADAAMSAGDAALGARIGALASRGDAAHERIDDLRRLVHELGLARDELIRTLNTIDEGLRARASAAEVALDGLARRHRELEGVRRDELEFVRRRVHAMNRWFEALQGALAEVEAVAGQRADGLRAFETRTAASLASDAARAARVDHWLDALGPGLAAVATIGDDADWQARCAARGIAAISLGSTRAGDGPMLRDALARVEDAGLAAVVVPALPALLRAMAADEFIDATTRILRPDGHLLVGFAAEPVLAAALAGDTPPPAQPVALAAALAGAGYATRRVDAADGTPALLAWRPSQ
ncbi:MAG: hypothetical protein ACTHK2_01700 [Dokdonella sp.]|uniref:hypothetical protein n=1 Tax=Dokdonella sp. TaxID=2291710 RepID=UPI003F80ED98